MQQSVTLEIRHAVLPNWYAKLVDRFSEVSPRSTPGLVELIMRSRDLLQATIRTLPQTGDSPHQ